MAITVSDVTKRFGDFVALDDVSLEVPGGSLTALLGPSGSGKSTLLRVIAGLESPDAGSVIISGEDATRVPVRKRGVGFVFQHYAAFKHMTVRDNVGFGLRIRKRSKGETRDRVDELLSLVQLDGLADRYPSQLSGGQRQRMALARALAVEPKVMLLDEPFGALDARVRKELRNWLRRLHEEVHQTTILVTHDQEEAMEVADRIVVMNQGRIEQVGPPDEVYDRPATPFVLQFLGDVNLFHGRLGGGEAAYVRPHELEILGAPGEGSLEVTLSQALTVGPNTRIEFKRVDDGSYVDVELPRADWQALRERLALAPGRPVHLRPRRVTRFAQVEATDPAALI